MIIFPLKLFICVLLFSSNVYALSIDELKDQLAGHPPMNVGFDVDDTVLFSSPAFYHAINEYCTHIPLEKRSADDKHFMGDKKCKEDDFWFSVNNTGVSYSMPKEIAYKLIDLHKSRGDKVLFISKRNNSKTEVLTEALAKMFDIKNINKVILTDGADKGPAIKANDIKIYYGDSDTDIKESQDVGVRAIRVERAPNSNYKLLYHPKIYGEDVIDNSAF